MPGWIQFTGTSPNYNIAFGAGWDVDVYLYLKCTDGSGTAVDSNYFRMKMYEVCPSKVTARADNNHWQIFP
jgi:hypothetical protein